MDQQSTQQTPVTSPVASSASPTMPQAGMPTPVSSPGGSPTQPATGPVAPPPPQAKKPSNMWMVIIVIVIILAVAGWLLYQYSTNKPKDSVYQDEMITTSPTTTVPSPTIGAVESGDKQLDQQSEEIDESMMKVETDINSIDTGLNDKSVDLSQ